MKKTIIFLTIILAVMLTAFLTFNVLKQNQLEVELSVEEIVYSLGLAPKIVLTGLETGYQTEYMVTPGKSIYEFESLKNDDYMVEIFLNDFSYKKETVKIENNGIFSYNKIHTISSSIDSPLHFEDIRLSFESGLPTMNWVINGILKPDLFKIKIGEKTLESSSETMQFLLSDILGYIFTHKITEINVEAFHSGSLLAKGTLDLTDSLYNTGFNYTVNDNLTVEIYKNNGFDSQYIIHKILSGDKLLQTISSDSLVLNMEEVYDEIEDNVLALKIITEYDNILINQQDITLDCYVYGFNLKTNYPLIMDQVDVVVKSLKEGKDYFYSFGPDNCISLYAFKKLTDMVVEIDYMGERVFDSSQTLSSVRGLSFVQEINLRNIPTITVESIDVVATSLQIGLNDVDFKSESFLKPSYLKIDYNANTLHCDYSTELNLEYDMQEDINLLITPVYFNDFRGDTLNIAVSVYVLTVDIPYFLKRESLSLFIDGQEVFLKDNCLKYYNFSNKKSIEMRIDYNNKNLMQSDITLGDERELEFSVYELAEISVDNVVYDEDLIKVEMVFETPENDSSEVFIPEYLLLEIDGQQKRVLDLKFTIENTLLPKTIRVIPVYRNGIEGKMVIFEKPARLALNINYTALTLKKYSDVNFDIFPAESEYILKCQRLTNGVYADCSSEVQGDILKLPLEIGENHFKIIALDKSGQLQVKTFMVKRLEVPVVDLKRIDCYGKKGLLTWTLNDFYDYYSVTLNKGINDVEQFDTDATFVEFDKIPSKFSISVIGHHKGISKLCFSRSVDVEQFMLESSVYDYHIDHEQDNKINATIRFDNFESLKSLKLGLYDSLGKNISSVDFLREEFAGNYVSFKWNAIPGETYNMIFHFVYEYSGDGVEYGIFVEQKSLNILAPRPDKVIWNNFYQIGKDKYFVETNDFGKNIIYRYTFSNGEIDYVFNSTVPTNEIHLKGELRDYFGDLKLTLKILETLENKVIKESEVSLKKVNADVYLSNSVLDSITFSDKKILVSNRVDFSNYVELKIENCVLLFNNNAFVNLEYADMYIKNSTVTSLYPRGEQAENALIEMYGASLKMENSVFYGIKAGISAAYDSKIDIRNSIIKDFDYFINSQKSSVIVDALTVENGEVFSENMFDKSVEVFNSRFDHLQLAFSIGISQNIKLKNSRFENIEIEAIKVYDSRKLFLEGLEFFKVGLAINVTNSDVVFRDSRISDSYSVLIAKNLDLLTDRLVVENVKNGLYISNCFSQIIDSKILTEVIGICYVNQAFKAPKETFSFYNYIDAASLSDKKVVSVVYNTVVKSKVAMEIASGENNVIFRGLPPNGDLIQESYYYDNMGIARKTGKFLYAGKKENSDKKWHIDDEEDVVEYTIPVSDIVDEGEYVTSDDESMEDNDSPLPFMKKYQDTGKKE